jgi:hypothetical protein
VIKAIHVFYDIFMGWSSDSLREIMLKNARRELRKGEIAVFLNKAWTGVKILAPNGAVIYFRAKSPLTIEQVRFLPTAFGARSFDYAGSLEDHMLQTFEKKFGKHMKRIKAAYA